LRILVPSTLMIKKRISKINTDEILLQPAKIEIKEEYVVDPLAIDIEDPI
jgi:hypothetical protein